MLIKIKTNKLYVLENSIIFSNFSHNEKNKSLNNILSRLFKRYIYIYSYHFNLIKLK